MNTLWLGLRSEALDTLLATPEWRGFGKAARPETWRVIDTADQRHRATPLLTAVKRANEPAGGATTVFDLTRTRWQDGALMLERVVWRLPNGREHSAAWLRLPVGPSGSEVRRRAEALHRAAAVADPVPIPILDPVEWGYRLAGNEPVVKPGKLLLTPSMTAGAVLAAILEAVVEALLVHLPSVVRQNDPVAVHQARVALRRLRAALPLFGPRVGPAERVEALRRRAGDLARRLGTVRDLDVFTTETLDRAARDFPTEAGWADLRKVALTRRDKEAGQLSQTVGTWEAADFLLDLLHWRDEATALLPSGPAAAEVARALLADRWRRVARRAEKLDHIDVPGLHELRIKIKKIRYLIDFTKSLFPREIVEDWERRFGALQDALGALNDGASARGLIHGLMPALSKEGAFAAGLLIAWADGRTLRHRHRIGKLWDGVAELPRYWEVEI